MKKGSNALSSVGSLAKGSPRGSAKRASVASCLSQSKRKEVMVDQSFPSMFSQGRAVKPFELNISMGSAFLNEPEPVRGGAKILRTS